MLLGLITLSAQLFILSSRQAAAADYISYQAVGAGGPEVFSGRAFVDPKRVADFLVVAVAQIESDGKARKVGRAGERGLMQIKRSTWKHVTRKLYGRALPFDHAFDPAINRRVGKAYLAELQAFLHAHKSRWRSDERSLLLACYNAGPTCVMAAGFNVKRVPASTRSYVERATALHEYYLAGDAARIRNLLLVQNRVRASDTRS
jgi:soluble lytic murein transglycosylase-like protein